jgi:O-antigen/teichoic acid export membrane protein
MSGGGQYRSKDVDEGGDDSDRHETPIERLDRNWSELLQELRVVQTGVQLLTGFLLTLPFQQRFAELTDPERAIYLVAVSASVLATGFLQAPVSVHRALFQRHRRRETVLLAHRLTIAGMAFLGAAIVTVTLLIFDVVLGWPGAVTAAAITAALLLVLWLAVPLAVRRGIKQPE